LALARADEGMARSTRGPSIAGKARGSAAAFGFPRTWYAVLDACSTGRMQPGARVSPLWPERGSPGHPSSS